MAVSTRQLVQIFEHSGKSHKSVAKPVIFNAAIRDDVVRFVHTNIAKNARQPYAVSKVAGHQTSAESWGTGRAVSRIPRVAGGGTHRAGQGAFGNMCRGGRMFAPTKTYRRWHRAINKKQRRLAVASAVAASGVVPLVQARGHRVDGVPELPLVVSDAAFKDVSKTKQAVKLLTKLGAFQDVEHAKSSRKLRAGKGKMRNRRYVQRRGPLFVHSGQSSAVRALRNLPGVETCNVRCLNLLQLAPGGHLGRFVVWSESAFKKLNSVFGTFRKEAALKSGFKVPQAKMTMSDLSRILTSPEILAVLRRRRRNVHTGTRHNPLANSRYMRQLNPHHDAVVRRSRKIRLGRAPQPKNQSTKKLIKKRKAVKKRRSQYYKSLLA